jgi:hypothetical protein
MHVVISGAAIGLNKLTPDDTTPRVRHILSGGNINVMCVLDIWHRSLETVTASSAVETYTVSDVDFASLFKGPTDPAYVRLQIKESFNFKMDRSFISDKTKYGKPLYFTNFSTMELTLHRMKCLKGGRKGSTRWVTVQLVDEGGNAYHDIWKHETAKMTPPTDSAVDELEMKETVRVSVFFC